MDARLLRTLQTMREKSEAVTVSTTAADWYDVWHFHVDWKGDGNGDPDVTRVVLECLRTAYRRIQAQVEGWSVPHQCWVIINATDSGQSAVYLHTPSANANSRFPLSMAQVDFEATRPFWIAEIFPEGEYRCGRTHHVDEDGVATESFWVL